MKRTFKPLALALILICAFSMSAMAEHSTHYSESPRVQDQDYLPYDQWYGPDETLDDAEDEGPESVVIPVTPDSDERVAPDEDTRPQAR